MSDFTTHNFEVGMSLKYKACRVEIISIDRPYAIVSLPTPDKKQITINLLALKKEDIINLDELQSDEALKRAELDDLLS